MVRAFSLSKLGMSGLRLVISAGQNKQSNLTNGQLF